MDRGALGELRGHHPRPRRDPRRRAGRDRGGQDPRHPGEGDRRHGGVLPAPHPRHPRARRLGLHGPVRHAGLLVRVHRRDDERHADGRVPRRRPAGGDVRPRARRRRPGAEDRQGPGRGTQDQPGPAVRRAAGGHLRPERRLGQLREGIQPGAGAGRLRRAAEGAGGTPAARRHGAAGDRTVQLHRDVRAGPVGDPRRPSVRGRRLGRLRRAVPADREGRAEDRHLARTARATSPPGRRSRPTRSA